MLHPEDITIGVVFTGPRDFNIDPFFTSVLQDESARRCRYLAIDNGCTFDLEVRLKEKFPDFPITIVRNDSIESLSYNHNLIYFHSNTPYIIHNNDEVYFQPNWLQTTLDWINTEDNVERIAHLCRCSKGYHRNTIEKMGYFNLRINGKDGSDSDIEYRELRYLEGQEISPQDFLAICDQNFASKIIGGSWSKSYFEPTGCPAWIGTVAVQPDNITNSRKGDSNLWLQREYSENLSERNKNIVMNWQNELGSQGLLELSLISGKIVTHSSLFLQHA